MIKWIGQHIWDFISRFRNDVYLENIADGTVVDNKFLGLDSNNKVVKEAASTTVTDLHTAGVDGANNQLLTDNGNGTINSEANLTWNNIQLGLEYSGADGPTILLTKTGDNATAPIINFAAQRAASGGAANNDDDYLGHIKYWGYNNAGTPEAIEFARISSQISERDDGIEEGSLALSVQSHGALRTGFYCIGNGSNVIDTTIGTGATSTATVAGNMSVTTRLTALDQFALGGHIVDDIQVAGDGFADVDDQLMSAAAIDDRINAAAGGVTADPFSTTVIKILPHQFMPNDDAGRPIMIEDDTSNTLGVRCSHTVDEMYAFQKIPTGYKVTHVQVHASASTSSAVTVRSFNYQTGADNNVSETSGDLNSNIDVTDIPASATQDLVIKVAPASASTIMYGATVTIATI